MSVGVCGLKITTQFVVERITLSDVADSRMI